MPCTPPPGGVELEHRKMRGLGVAYGSHRSTGLASTCASVLAPPLLSPPTRFASCGSLRARRNHVARQDAVAEPRREALDLSLDALGHVDAGAVGNVTVRPARVPSPRPIARAPRRHHSPPADAVHRFDDQHGSSGMRERDGRGETVGPAPTTPASSSMRLYPSPPVGRASTRIRR